MKDALKQILHQLKKITFHIENLECYQSSNLITKKLLQAQIDRLIEYVKTKLESIDS